MAIHAEPIDNPLAWDVVIVGGVKSPGLAHVSGAKRSHEWDVKKGKGAQGATLTFVQKPPVKFTITFTAGYFDWSGTYISLALWNDFLPLFKYDPTKKTPTAIDIYHAALADVDVTSVVAEEIGQWEHKGKGLWERTIALIEYTTPPKKSAVSTLNGSAAAPKGSGGGAATPGPAPSAPDKYDQEIDQLLKKAQEP